jgi:hypothetical protein
MLSNAILFASVLFGQPSEEKTVKFKFKELAKGEVVKMEILDEGENSLIHFLDDKETKNENKKMWSKDIYFETLLEKAGDGEEKNCVLRKYEEARFLKEGKKVSRVYNGENVLIEKKGDRFKFRIEAGKELTGQEAEALDLEYNVREFLRTLRFDSPLVSGMEIKVGKPLEWDGSNLLKLLNLDSDLDSEGLKCAFEVLEVYEKRGRKFAKSKIEMEAPITKFGPKNRKIKVAEGGKMKLHVQIDGCVDGTSHEEIRRVEVSMNFATTTDVRGKELKSVSSIKLTGTKKISDVPQK